MVKGRLHELCLSNCGSTITHHLKKPLLSYAQPCSELDQCWPSHVGLDSWMWARTSRASSSNSIIIGLKLPDWTFCLIVKTTTKILYVEKCLNWSLLSFLFIFYFFGLPRRHGSQLNIWILCASLTTSLPSEKHMITTCLKFWYVYEIRLL